MGNLVIDDVILSTVNVAKANKRVFVERMIERKYPFVNHHYCNTCGLYEPALNNDFGELICLVCLNGVDDYE